MRFYLNRNRPPKLETPDMSERIIWNARERQAVAAAAFAETLKDPSLSVVAAVSRAQVQILPVDRQRPLDAKRAPDLKKWVEPMWAQLKTEAARATRAAHAKRGMAELFEPVATVEPETPAAPVSDPANAPDDARPSSSEVATAEAASVPAIEPGQNEAHTARRQIHWRDDERKKLCERAYSNLKRWPDMSRIESFRKAQDSELAADRRRDSLTWTMIKDWAEPMLEALALDEKIAEAREREERELRELEAEIVRAQAESSERQAAIDAAVAARMEAMTFDDLINAFARRFGRSMYAGVMESMQQAFSGRPGYEPPPASRQVPPGSFPPPHAAEQPRQRLPRVCVVGLLNQQAEDVRRAFLGVIEFVFVQSQQTGGSGGHGGAGMLQKSSSCDLVISMVGFAGHDVDASAKKLTIPFRRVNGSVSALKRELREWLDEGVALRAA